MINNVVIVSGELQRDSAIYIRYWGFPGGPNGKEPTCQCRRGKGHGFDPSPGIHFRYRDPFSPKPLSRVMVNLMCCGVPGYLVQHYSECVKEHVSR